MSDITRRSFLAGVASLSALGNLPSAARADDGVSSRHVEEVVAQAVRLMQEQGLHKDPTYGYYFSGYGENLFSVEAYFDSVVLFHVGDVALGRAALRIYMEQQHDNGFIPRHWEGTRTSPAGQAPALTSREPKNPYALRSPYMIYEREEHAQPFLFQIALFSTRIGGGDISWLDDGIYRKLKKYLHHWTEDWDRDSNGLC